MNITINYRRKNNLKCGCAHTFIYYKLDIMNSPDIRALVIVRSSANKPRTVMKYWIVWNYAMFYIIF